MPQIGLPSQIGGWDAPHPNTSFTGNEWWATWKTWNAALARSVPNFDGFDGIDWDLEGNDVQSSRWNEFSIECVELVGTMSQAAKDDGFIVTMVPPESVSL